MVAQSTPQFDLDGLRRWLDDQPGLAAAWVFGSVARAESRPDSDLDVAVLCGDAPPDRPDSLQFRLDLVGSLSRALGVPQDRVDVVVLDDAPPLLAQAVLVEGKLWLDRDPARRVAFQERALHRYVIAARLRDEAMFARARRFGVELPP
jgi:predicted nucleotidyltransferase